MLSRVEADRFWLDHAAWHAYRDRRRLTTILMVVGLLIAMALVFWL